MGGFAHADTQPPATPPPVQDCRAPEHREFDFWLGAWDVTNNGKAAGTNRIEGDLSGCVLVEQWKSASGGRGTSLNFFDRRKKSWHQTWIDAQGNALELDGALVGKSMILKSAPQRDASGKTAIQRITWTPNADGSVRQHWESSNDGGKTWTTAFDGRYVKSS
jgi:hypothetical protein